MARARTGYDPFAISVADIQRLCGYLQDKAVADHFDICIERVQHARSRMPAAEPARFMKNRTEPIKATSGRKDAEDFADMSKKGSVKLLDALERQFRQLARNRRYTFPEARALLMNCPSPSRRGGRCER